MQNVITVSLEIRSYLMYSRFDSLFLICANLSLFIAAIWPFQFLLMTFWTADSFLNRLCFFFYTGAESVSAAELGCWLRNCSSAAETAVIPFCLHKTTLAVWNKSDNDFIGEMECNGWMDGKKWGGLRVIGWMRWWMKWMKWRNEME